MLLGVVITDNSPQLGGGGLSLIITPSWGVISLIITPSWGVISLIITPSCIDSLETDPLYSFLSTRFIMLIGYFKEILKLTF